MKIIKGQLPPPCQLSLDLPASNITLSHYLLQMQLFLGSKRATEKELFSLLGAGQPPLGPTEDTAMPCRGPEENGTSGHSLAAFKSLNNFKAHI